MARLSKLMTVLLLALLTAGAAMAELKAGFDIQPRLLRLGETARCTLTVSGVKNPPQPNFPSIDGVSIRPAGRSSNFSIDNLKTSRSIVFSYVVAPTRTGEFTIGPYTYRAGGEEVELPAITLKVLDSKGRAADGERGEQSLSDMLFARIEVPEGVVYTHQVFTIGLNVFAREGLNLSGKFDPYGFPASRLNMGEFVSRGMTRVEIEGAIYNLYRFAAPARALSSGDYSFQPGLRAGLRVESRAGRRSGPFGDAFFDSFFDRGRVEYVDVPVEPVKLDVQPLPSEGRPESFSGAVGDFSFSASASPEELDAGEPITIKMLVEGRGNIDNITPPKLDLGDEFKTYEPRLVSGDSNGGSGSARKLFEEVVVPRSEEIAEVPAIEFSYFDPVDGEYKTIERGPFPVKVNPASSEVLQVAARQDAQEAGGEPEILGADIVYLKDAPSEPGDNGRVFAALSTPLSRYLQILPLLVLAILFAWQRRREFLQGNVAVARRQRAPRAARAALGRAEKALRDEDRAQFFESVWQTAADYFGNRLNLAPGEVGMEQVEAFVRRAGLDQNLAEDLRGIMQRCERERFGAGGGGEDWREDAGGMLKSLRSIMKRCERLRLKQGGMAVRTIVVLAMAALLASGMLISLAAPADQISPARRFARAAESYDAGDLDAALQDYRALLQAKEVSPQLYYNMGNTYFRMNRLGEAILYYRKAQYLVPRDPDLSANIALAVRESGALLPDLPPLLRLFTSFSANGWLLLMLSLYWICAAMLAAAIMLRRQRGLLLKMFGLLILPLLLAFAGVAAWNIMLARDEAVVVGEECQALFAPIEDSTAHFTLPVGSIVSVKSRSDGWRQIEVDDMSGWIPEDACRLVQARE